MTEPSIDGRKFAWIFLGLLTVGLAIAYGNSLGIGFYLDDRSGIRDNAAIRSLANIPRFFTDPTTLTLQTRNMDVRPVLVTTFALNHAISGINPWSYHVFNLIVHFVTSLLVFVLIRDHIWWPISQRGATGSARWPAAAAALFFALAPLNNQALNSMWERSALLCTAFYIAAFYALMNGRIAAAVFLQMLALFTKSIAFTLPAVFVAYDFFYRDRKRHPDLKTWLKDWKELIPPLAPLVVADVIYLVYRARVLPPEAFGLLSERWVTPWIWFMSQWSALLHYAKVFVWPTGLSIDSDFPYTMAFAEPRAWGSLFLLVVWIGMALKYSRRFPHVAFATAWFFLTLAPESSFVALPGVVNDCRPYIASTLGLSVLLAWLVERGSRLAKARREVVFGGIVLALCLVAAGVGRHRTGQWATESTLWESTVRTSPGNGRAWMNVGRLLMAKGNQKEARRYFERAKELLPAYPVLFMNFSALELSEGRKDEAIAAAQRAVLLGPDLSQAHFVLGDALFAKGRLTEAVASYRLAEKLAPGDGSVRSAFERALAAEAADVAAKAESAKIKERLAR